MEALCVHGEGEVAGKIALEAGMHRIEARMFQRKGGQALNLYISGPEMPKREADKSMPFHTAVMKAGKR